MTALRPPLIAGAALILGGTLALLHALGILPGGVPIGPLVVILVGVLILSAGTREAAAPTAAPGDVMPLALSIDGAASARLVLSHGAGTLRVGAGAQEGYLVEGTATGRVKQTVTRRDGHVDVTLAPTGPWDRWPARTGVVWDLALSPVLPLDIEVRTGASQVRLDLSQLAVRSLTVHTGASDVEVTLPAHGVCAVSVSAGAADVRIRVPDGVAAAVRNRSALAGFRVDETRFPRLNGAYRSPDFDTAADRVDIDIDGGVGSFSVL